MNKAQFKCLAVFSLFAVIGFGPVSPGCLIGMYVVVKRPAWFLRLARDLYSDKANDACLSAPEPPRNPLQTRKKCFLSLLGLFTLDIAPVPVTPCVAFVFLLARPNWFYRMVETIYSDGAEKGSEGVL